MKEHIKSKLGLLAGERGQSIIILALAVVVLLAFVGMAIDVGLLYGRRIQLSRAVDAAALAAAMELPDGPYQDRAEQFVRTNGFDPVEANVIATPGGAGLGQSNYLTVTAQLRMDTMFLRFVGFPTVHVPALAVAEFKSPIEVYASQHTESGVAGVVNLNVFGQEGNTIYGDAFSPLQSSELPGETCSCGTPCDNTTQGDQWRTKLQGRDGRQGVYPFRIHVPADYESENGTSVIQVEILDPDSYNSSGNTVTITHLDVDGGGTESKNALSTDPDWTAMAETDDGQNPKWFVRMDQNVSFCGDDLELDPSEDVTTEYTLYYYKQNDLTPYEIAQYTVRQDSDTDLEWVIPGVTSGVDTDFGSFRFDLDDYPDVRTDENGKSFYIDVEGISGPGGNGYDLWAGPSHSVYTTNVNLRNVYLLNEINEGNNPHDSGGVVVWAIGFLPLNVNTDTTYTITLSYIPPEAAGTSIRVSNFDLDRDTDELPSPDCDCDYTPPGGERHHCFGERLEYFLEGHPWEGLVFGVGIDGDVSCSSNFGEDVLEIPHEFYGGYLYAVFKTKTNDTTDWMLEYLDVMDDTYVRLIQ